MAKYEIINHGWEHAQYFKGCGIAFTSYDYCVTGSGDNAKEAYEDAVDGLYQMHDEIEIKRLKLPTRPCGINKKDKVPHRACERDKYGTDDCELYWYVSIRYSL